MIPARDAKQPSDLLRTSYSCRNLLMFYGPTDFLMVRGMEVVCSLDLNVVVETFVIGCSGVCAQHVVTQMRHGDRP